MRKRWESLGSGIGRQREGKVVFIISPSILLYFKLHHVSLWWRKKHKGIEVEFSNWQLKRLTNQPQI